MTTKVRLDLNNPEFQEQLFGLQKQQRHDILNSLKKLRQMTWDQVYVDRGLHWERIFSKKGSHGETLYSIRITREFRAIVIRDENWMSFLTVHPRITIQRIDSTS